MLFDIICFGLIWYQSSVKAAANRTTCWPTFQPTSADKHVVQHVCPVFFGQEHVGVKEKLRKNVGPKKLRNVGQQICKNGLKSYVGAVCGASQHGI